MSVDLNSSCFDDHNSYIIKLTKHGLESNCAQNEVVEINLTLLIAVSYRETRKCRVTHAETCDLNSHRARYFICLDTRDRLTTRKGWHPTADIYLLDDPLSAVDIHVGRHIFKQ